MKKSLCIILLSLTLAGRAQIVSRFTWSSSPLTKAAVGPNGTSINATAYSAVVGAPVNYAINPGTPTKDIDLVVPGSPTFDIPGIDIDLYFRREESEASFFKRGSLFEFGMLNAQLYVKFTTNKGSNPGTISVNSGNVAAVADDHAFHHYRFRYDNNTGMANIYIDDVVVYTYNGTAGYTLNWSGAGDVVIGSKMDATGRNLPVLGNMTIQSSAAMLPVSLLSFDVSAKNNNAILSWSTVKEINVSKFIVEYSTDGVRFETAASIPAAGSYDLVHRYQATDKAHATVVYYRLKMVDVDGSFTYSEVRKLSFGPVTSISCFPNPAVDHITLSLTNAKAGDFKYVVMTMNGNIISAADVRVENGSQQISIGLSRGTPAGMLVIRLVNVSENKTDLFRVIKS